MRFGYALLATTLLSSMAVAQSTPSTSPRQGRVARRAATSLAKFTPPTADQDYAKREVMVPMRDGVKLHTVIVVCQGRTNAPIVLTRTPYNASRPCRSAWTAASELSTLPRRATRCSSRTAISASIQDIRGKYGSEGDYVVTPPGDRPTQHGPRSITSPTPTTRSTGW